MSMTGVIRVVGLAIVAAWPLATVAQNPVRPTQELFEANAAGVPIDPATRVDPASMPRDIGRRTLEPLGLTEKQLDAPLAVNYSATHLEDDAGKRLCRLQQLQRAIEADEPSHRLRGLAGLLPEALDEVLLAPACVVCQRRDASSAAGTPQRPERALNLARRHQSGCEPARDVRVEQVEARLPVP